MVAYVLPDRLDFGIEHGWALPERLGQILKPKLGGRVAQARFQLMQLGELAVAALFQLVCQALNTNDDRLEALLTRIWRQIGLANVDQRPAGRAVVALFSSGLGLIEVAAQLGQAAVACLVPLLTRLG